MNNISGNIHVTGEIETHVPPKLAEERNTSEKKKDTRDSRRFIVECVTVVLIAIYASLTALLGCQTHKLVKTAQDTYNATDRPYIGAAPLPVEFFRIDESGKVIIIQRPESGVTGMAFGIGIKNYGSVPGEDVVADMDARLNGEKVPGIKVPANATELFPSELVAFPGRITGKYYQSIVNETGILQINLSVDYAYAGKTYHYCEREQYAPGAAGFMNLGTSCDDPWATAK